MSEFKIEPKQILNKVKVLLSMDLKLAQMKNEDGSVVFEAESFEPEFSVGVVSDEGIVPAPVGEYTLEDGSVMVVEVEGIIASIGMPETAMDETPDATATPDASPVKKTVETVSKETFFSKEEVEELVNEHEVALSKIETLETEKKELEVKLAKAEEVKPIKHNPEVTKEVKFSDLPKHVQLLKMREKLN